MSPQSRLLARSPFITRAVLITLFLSASVAVVTFAAVSASGPRNPVPSAVTSPSVGTITSSMSGTTITTFAPLVTTVTAGPDVDAANNDYRRIQNAINAAASGDTIMLSGTFDFTQPFAAAAWALGNDNTNGTADDYEVLATPGVNNVTITASSLGAATIQGPGDLAAVNLEGVFVFDGGPNQGWTISNIRFMDFDLSIAFFDEGHGVTAFNNTHLTNNYIRIARDLNATVAPADVNQNIGIHFSFGTNQVISGNTIEIQGDGVSNGSNFATDVGMQSNTSGGNVYDGLQITNNIIRVLNAQDALTRKLSWASGKTLTGTPATSPSAATNSLTRLPGTIQPRTCNAASG